MRVRPATINDINAIHRINENELGYPLDKDIAIQQLNKILSNSDHTVYVAEDEHVLGYIHFCIHMPTLTPTAYTIMELAVSSHAQGQGVGKLLIQAMEKNAIDHEIHFIHLGSGTARTSAHTFYERMGYTLKNQQKIYIKSL